MDHPLNPHQEQYSPPDPHNNINNTDNGTANDLWDELSHQHSREIQQHQQGSHSSSQLQNTLQHVWHETSSTLRQTATRIAQVFPDRRITIIPPSRHAYQPPPQNLHDFGLHDPPEQGANGASVATGEPLLQGGVEYGYAGGDGPSSTQDNDPFVLLRPFRLAPPSDGWGAVANLDLFFTSLYSYYYNRGLLPIIGKGLVELVSLVITLVLSVFLFAYVDWNKLADCHDEATCANQFSDYVRKSPFSHTSLWNFLTLLYCFLFAAYTAFCVWTWWHTIQNALSSRAFFKDTLGIPSFKLQGGAIEWEQHVVEPIVQLQTSGRHRVAINHGNDLDALVIANRIMRKENFLIALWNRNMLDLTVPLLPGSYFCKSLEWSLYFCVLNYMFNHKYQIRPAFYLDPSSLKRRFMLCGIAHAVFMPFLLFFMTLHFFMQNVYDMKSSKQYLGPREWSLSAKWTFREFNELPHVFERRMAPSYDCAGKYLELFTQSAIVTSIGRILVFIGGSFGAVLIAFAALNDAILLHVKIGDWNLLWYVGVFGIVYSTGKALQPSPNIHPPYIRNLFGEMEAALGQVTTHTHYYPETWKSRAWDETTRKAMASMFRYKAQLFGLEVISFIVAPVILCISLPKCAEHICEFVMSIKSEIPGAGDVCGYASFNFDVFGDANWEGRTMRAGPAEMDRELTGSLSASLMQTKNVESATNMHPKPEAMHGKMEKSFFNFKSSHPCWQSTESGQTLLDRIEEYKNNETMEMARERQHHIEAAARQLETLAQLEQQRRLVGPAGQAYGAKVDESYIGKAAGGADSGGGVGIATHQRSTTELGAIDTSPRVHFDGSTREESQSQQSPSRADRGPGPGEFSAGLPPPGRSMMSGLRSPSPANPAALSVLHYADLGLSSELRRILNRSTLDSDASGMGSVLGGTYDPTLSAAGPSQVGSTGDMTDRENVAQRQYQWLERYHAHLAEQRNSRGVTQSLHVLEEHRADESSDGDTESDQRSSIV